MGIAITILLVVIIGLLVGTTLNFAAVFVAIPLFLLVVGSLLLGRESMERQRKIRQMKRFRREARAQKVDFDAEDRRTVV